MSITLSDITIKRDNEAKDQCWFIHDRGMEHVSGIGTYGITEAFWGDFKQLIIDYGENISKPRMSIAERMQLTRNIELKFEELHGLLKAMDIKVFALSSMHAEMIAHHKDCKRILNYRGSVLAIKGTIVNEMYAPLFGATVSILSLERSVKSTRRGYFEFRHLPNGQYAVVIERPDYEKQVVTVGVVKDETF